MGAGGLLQLGLHAVEGGDVSQLLAQRLFAVELGEDALLCGELLVPLTFQLLAGVHVAGANLATAYTQRMAERAEIQARRNATQGALQLR